MKIITALIGAVLGVGVGFALFSSNEVPTQTDQGSDEVVVQLDCPEEDLCDANYDGELGKWVVTQTPYDR